MLKIEELKFDERGLIPAIVVDTESKQVLTLAYMNAESLCISMEEGSTCFYSRFQNDFSRCNRRFFCTGVRTYNNAVSCFQAYQSLENCR